MGNTERLYLDTHMKLATDPVHGNRSCVYFLSHYWTYQDRQCTYKVLWRRLCVTIVAVGISIYYTLRVSAALVIPHAMRMRRIVIRRMRIASATQPYFTALSHTRHKFWGKEKLFSIKCVFRISPQLCLKIFAFCK